MLCHRGGHGRADGRLCHGLCAVIDFVDGRDGQLATARQGKLFARGNVRHIVAAVRSTGQRGLASGRHGDAVDLDLGDRHLRPFIYYAPIVPHRQCHFIGLDVLGTECEMLRDGLPRIGGGYKTVAVGVVCPIAVTGLYGGNADIATRRINRIQMVGNIHRGVGIHIFLRNRNFG